MSFGAMAASYMNGMGSFPGQKVALGFGEGAGTTVADSSGSGNTFTLSSGAAWTTGHTGTGLSGVAGYAYGNFGGGVAWNEWTIMCWLRRTSDTDCVVWGSSDDQLWLEVANSGNPGRVSVWSLQQNDGVIYNSPVLPLNTWAHITVINTNSGGLALYVNGTFTWGSLSQKSHHVNPASAFAFGAYDHTGGSNFEGQIDDVRVFDRALDEAEITTIMNTPVV